MPCREEDMELLWKNKRESLLLAIVLYVFVPAMAEAQMEMSAEDMASGMHGLDALLAI